MRNWCLLLFFSGVLLSCSDSKIVERYPNGAVKVKHVYSNVNAGDFVEYKFYQKGELKEENRYRSNLLEGLSKSFYQSGNKESEVLFEKGKEYGVWTFWYQDGGIRLKGQSEKGKYNWVEEYYPNETKAYRLDYNPPGVKNGEAKFYHNNGTLKLTGHYLDDKKVGLWKQYTIEGTLEKEQTFDADKLLLSEVISDAEYAEINITKSNVLLTTQRAVLTNKQDSIFELVHFILNESGEVKNKTLEGVFKVAYENNTSIITFRERKYELTLGEFRTYQLPLGKAVVFKYVGKGINVFFNDKLGLIYMIFNEDEKKLIELKAINQELKFQYSNQLMDTLKADISFNVFSVLK